MNDNKTISFEDLIRDYINPVVDELAAKLDLTPAQSASLHGLTPCPALAKRGGPYEWIDRFKRKWPNCEVVDNNDGTVTITFDPEREFVSQQLCVPPTPEEDDPTRIPNYRERQTEYRQGGRRY